MKIKKTGYLVAIIWFAIFLVLSILAEDLFGSAFAISGFIFIWIIYLKDKSIFYQQMLIDSLNDLIDHQQKALNRIDNSLDEIITNLGIDPNKISNENSEESKES